MITALVMGKGNQLRRITLDEGTNPEGVRMWEARDRVQWKIP